MKFNIGCLIFGHKWRITVGYEGDIIITEPSDYCKYCGLHKSEVFK